MITLERHTYKMKICHLNKTSSKNKLQLSLRDKQNIKIKLEAKTIVNFVFGAEHVI